MEKSHEFSFYRSCDDQVYGPSDFDYHYWNAPQIPSFGSDITDFVQPNLWHESVTYDVPPVTTYGGIYLSDFQEYDDVYNSAYYLQPNYIPWIPTQYHLYCIYQPMYYVYTPVYQEYYVPSHFYIPTPTYDASVSSYVDTSPFFENEVLPPFVEENVDAYEEFNSSLQNIGNGVPGDMYDSMEELVGEEITSCHFSYDECPEMMNDAVVANEEGRKKQLKELKWRRHRLASIREDEEPDADSAEMECGETLENDVQIVENDVVSNKGPGGESRNMDRDPQMVKVGDIYVRYAPDRYRVFCLENRRKKRFPSVRKFFGRIFSYVKKPI